MDRATGTHSNESTSVTTIGGKVSTLLGSKLGWYNKKEEDKFSGRKLKRGGIVLRA